MSKETGTIVHFDEETGHGLITCHRGTSLWFNYTDCEPSILGKDPVGIPVFFIRTSVEDGDIAEEVRFEVT